VNLAYLPKNVPPQIISVVVQDPGIRIGGAVATPGASPPVQLRLPSTNPFPLTAAPPARPAAADGPRPGPAPQGVAQKGHQSVLWSAEDANDDDLRYSVYFRAEDEKDWKLLRDKIEQRFYSWDTTSMPDGSYYLKVVASDAESNPADAALTGERESERFVVDNTAPELDAITAQQSRTGSQSATDIRFSARDSTSAILRAQYSLDAGDWTSVLPMDRLSDSTHEQYELTLRALPAGEHTVAVRVFDQFENVVAGKVTFTVMTGR
jgi:hypothetical protein